MPAAAHHDHDRKPGRPGGQLTREKRRVLTFITTRQQQNKPYTIGEVMRACGFVNRWNANRVIKGLRDMGLLN
jgi:hypothetical protein